MPPKKKPKVYEGESSVDEGGQGRRGPSSLRALIAAGENIRIVGYMTNVPFNCFIVDGMAIKDEGMRQRGLHDHSITETSIRTNGWNYDQGAPVRMIEKPWDNDEWRDFIAAGSVPTGTPKPISLRHMDWPSESDGSLPHVKHECIQTTQPRRFFLDDGSHRATAMHKMIAEGHPHAIEICERNMILLDCDPTDDKDKAFFSSMLANIKQQELDKDFLADKIAQIKNVSVVTYTHTHRL
jgi:hypothetical protein